MSFLPQDWGELFRIEGPILELLVRGTFMYLALLVLLRFFMKRHSGKIGAPDMLVMVLVADAAQNGMAGEYRSISEGLILVATIVGWAWVVDFLEYRFELVSRLLHPAPVPLIEHGKLRHAALKRQLLSERELMSKLRENGIEDLREVQLARMEGDGSISIERRKQR